MGPRSPAVFKRPYPAVVAAVAGVLVLVSAFVVFLLYQSRERYHANAEDTTHNLALATESFLNAHFEEVDLALRQADKEFKRLHDRGQFSRERFSDYLVSLKERIPNARAIRGSDRDGWVIYGEDIDLSNKQSLSIRPFFHRARDERTLIFGMPVRSRISGEWVFPIVYPLSLSNGEFGGVAYVLINTERISDVFRAYNLGQNGVVTMFDAQRRVLLRYPEQAGKPSTDGEPPVLNASGTTQALAAGKTSASFQAFSSIDGLHRTLSFQKIGQYPMYVIVGMASEEYLAAWQREALTAGLFLAVLYTCTLSLLMFLRHAWRQQSRAVAELTESEARMRSLTEGLPQMVWMTDGQGRLNMLSHHWGEFTGLKDTALLNAGNWLQAVHPQEQAAVREAWQHAVEQRGEWRQVCRLRRHDGTWRVFDHQALPQLDQLGQVRCWVGSSTDITATQEAHDSLLAAKEQALQAGQAKSAFLANMSHEIRTPMNAIIGMLQLLRQTELNHRQGDYVDKTQSAAKALLSILNDILDYSKVESGKLTLDPHRFSLDRLLRDVGVILSANLGSKDIEVLYRVTRDTPMWLEGDALRLQQVLINLAGNAIKFTEHGEVELSITPLHRRAGRVSLRFAVRDTGIGITPEQKQRIFDDFSQAEVSTSRRFGGTGLGLAISQRLVRMMGGELQLVSQPGAGSTFSFTIELPEATEPHGGAALQTPGSTSTRGISALVVDDNACARSAIHDMALTLGWQADTAASGDEAVQLVERQLGAQHPYDVIFLDGRMPKRDGWQTSERIRNLQTDHKPPLIIMVTAYGREMLARRQLEDPRLLDGILVKPVTPGMLLDAVTLPDRSLFERPYQAATPRSTRLTGLNLLLVEDNPTNQQVARELLAHEGATVTLADCGEAALTALRNQADRFDLVLMDIQMPDMDGYVVTRTIRQQLGLSTLPIIAMTANAMPSDREAALSAGMNDHVGKPFDLDMLVGVIQAHAPTPREVMDPTVVLDTMGALKRLGGFKAIYARTLRHYADDAQATLARWSEILASPQLSRTLHTLKGMAATIGAQQVAELAGRLEQTLQQQADTSEPSSLPEELEALRLALAESMEAAVRHAVALDDPASPTSYTVRQNAET